MKAAAKEPFLKVLVADDDPDIRRILRDLLGKDYLVIEAVDGLETLEAVKRDHPRLILLDVAMPAMSGIAALDAVRSLDAAPVVVMLTSACDIEIAKRALDLGAAEYVTKPFDSDELLGKVRRLMGSADGNQEQRPYRPWRLAAEEEAP